MSNWAAEGWLLAFVVGMASAASAQLPVTRQTLHGVVTDSAGVPLGGGEIRHVLGDSTMTLARTSASGRFTILIAAAAPGRLVVRRLGYARVDIAIGVPRDSLDTLRVILAPAAVTLEDVLVNGEPAEMAGWLTEFHRRRDANSFGRYFTRDEIRAAGKHHMSELLRLTPGVTLSPSRRFGYVVRMRGCRDAPMIWLDGTRLPGAELDEVTKPDDIAGLEVYTSTAGVPAQYQDRSNRGCGTILIWTRHQ